MPLLRLHPRHWHRCHQVVSIFSVVFLSTVPVVIRHVIATLCCGLLVIGSRWHQACYASPALASLSTVPVVIRRVIAASAAASLSTVPVGIRHATLFRHSPPCQRSPLSSGVLSLRRLRPPCQRSPLASGTPRESSARLLVHGDRCHELHWWFTREL